MPQTTQIERAGADQIERAYVGANYANSANSADSADFAPSFADLLSTGERELIREPLREWLAKGDRAGATYVYEAWLKAGGEPELIRESLRKWLADSATAPGYATAPDSATAPGNTAPGYATAPANATAERASFVYTAWLKVTGEVELVREALGAWFEPPWRVSGGGLCLLCVAVGRWRGASVLGADLRLAGRAHERSGRSAQPLFHVAPAWR